MTQRIHERCCWHFAAVQHAMTNHRDEVCCHCGMARCVYLERLIPAGHGPHTPEGDRDVLMVGNLEGKHYEPPKTS